MVKARLPYIVKACLFYIVETTENLNVTLNNLADEFG